MGKNDTLKFKDMVNKINKYLAIEKIYINLQGYDDIITKYFRLGDNDINEAYELMTECNVWNNYFSEIEGIIQYYTLASQLSFDIFNATYNKMLCDNELDRKYMLLDKRYKDFKLFSKQVAAQKKFFEKAFWHCYKIYAKSVKTYMHYGDI